MNALEGGKERLRDIAWVATQNLAEGRRAKWLPAALKAVDGENTRAALDRVRAAVKRLDEIEDEFFAAGRRGSRERRES